MKKTILIFGSIAGIIVTTMMVFATYQCYNNQENFEPSMVLGYLGMLLAFSFVFVGIRNFRNNYNGGVITFGKAFKVGFLIALVASIFYVGVWLIEYYYFIPDFMDKYIDFVINQSKAEGLTDAEMQVKIQDMETYREWYKNPLMVILLTFSEILPLGIIVSLISALILKKNPQRINS
ncbi:hypothetical protein J2X31_001825 [Flavobacterium arsenatis]|uniref:DUF4199 domain-containing protein n=1 Tax=Flavobacterium arsenatis TaxID=1484332 RepID=A0ABU1TPB4_9FLAO|nr:DUF4199 domain-containing protein [Flavobacterium arsenatis]MDR6967813.1 hypothetical protein [Flavobacterium arsenatis]